MTELLQAESTLTQKYQTTIPYVVRQALGLEKGSKINYQIQADGNVLISRQENNQDESDPSIMGFTAGIQLAANKMVALGDWIEMPKYGANGSVIELSLYKVKVQNWDKTITLIPTYALISDSFKNWRGMFESGGRRIKRSVYIDINSIKFCDREMLDRFSQLNFVADYIQEKYQELTGYNAKTKIINNSVLNEEKWITNVGIFRAYLIAYLKAHPQISDVHTFLVRQLQSTEHGLPIEIYVFSLDTKWVNYENIQADIFDHILSIVPEFELRVFQNVSGYDFQKYGYEQP